MAKGVHLHWLVARLEVERRHLGSDVPHRDRVVVGRVHPLGLGVDPAQLDLVVPEEHLDELELVELRHDHLLGEGGHLVRDPLLLAEVPGDKDRFLDF